MNKAIREVYESPKHPGSFSGADKIREALKKVKHLHVSVKDVNNWLKTNDTYTKHRPSRVTFKRNQIIAPHIDAQWQGDLAEVGNIAEHNDGVRYLLILIDVVSKYTWVQPLKTKSGPEVLAAFKTVFETGNGRKPLKLQTDDGKEFWYRGLQKYLQDEGIKFFTLKSDKKAAIAERMVRTIKEKIYRYMHERHTKKYIDVLQDLVSSYNATYHKSIKMAPEDVSEKNEGLVLRTLYGSEWINGIKKRAKPKLQEGDFVRISNVKGVFKKGYTGNWSEEIFIVTKVKRSVPYVVYKLKDWSGEQIQGSFYEHEVQGVSKDLRGFWKVEKVLDTKKIRGKKHYLVKWEGYPDSMNSWVEESAIKQIGV